MRKAGQIGNGFLAWCLKICASRTLFCLIRRQVFNQSNRGLSHFAKGTSKDQIKFLCSLHDGADGSPAGGREKTCERADAIQPSQAGVGDPARRPLLEQFELAARVSPAIINADIEHVVGRTVGLPLLTEPPFSLGEVRAELLRMQEG